MNQDNFIQLIGVHKFYTLFVFLYNTAAQWGEMGTLRVQ